MYGCQILCTAQYIRCVFLREFLHALAQSYGVDAVPLWNANTTLGWGEKLPQRIVLQCAVRRNRAMWKYNAQQALLFTVWLEKTNMIQLICILFINYHPEKQWQGIALDTVSRWNRAIPHRHGVWVFASRETFSWLLFFFEKHMQKSCHQEV